MKNKLSFISLFTVVLMNAQQKKIAYLDRAWKETTKDKAVFFKPIPVLLNDSIEFERVYFISGKLRYQGYSLVKKDYKEYIGSRYWYNENGFDADTDYSSFDSEKLKGFELKFYYPNGKLWKIQKLNGKKALEEVYFEDGSLRNIDSVDYSKTTYNGTNKIYWLKSKHLASESFYDEKNNLNGIKNYDLNGNLIYNIGSSQIIDGKIINQEYNIYNTINGYAVNSENYNPKEKINTNHVINIQNIDLVSIGGYFSLLRKKEKGYNYFNFENTVSKENKKNRAYTEIDGFGTDNYLLDKIQTDEVRILNPNEIKAQRIEDLKKNLVNKVFTYYDESEEVLYKYSFPSPEIVLEEVYTFSKGNSGGGFGYHEIKDDDNDNQKWRLSNSGSYNSFIININNSQPVILFNGKKSIVPLNDGFLINGKTVKTEEKNTEKIYWIDAQNHYSIIEENGKKQLYSVFGEQIFPKSYDDILMSDYFFITRSGNDYTVYDSFLNKLVVDNIKSIYLKDSYINVLHDGKVENLNQLLKEALPKKYYYATCSQDPNTYYRFSPAYDKKHKRNVVARIRNRWDSSEIESYALKNLPKKAKLNYIYNEIKIGRKDILNYFKSDPYNIEDFYITAEYKGKKGLYTFNKETGDFVSDADIEIKNKEFEKDYAEIRSEANIRHLEEFETNKHDENDDQFSYYDFNYEYDAINLLPMEYDDIIFRDEIIIFSKNKKYGVYQLSKEPKYKKIGIRKDNFLEITNEKNQQGWLDLASNIEYYN